MSANKDRGSRWEKDIVDYLRSVGFQYAERRLAGSAKDRGDIAGIPGVVVEAKSQNRITLSEWMDEAVVEGQRDNAWLAVTWVKRKGRGSAADGYVVMTGTQFAEILRTLCGLEES